MARAAAISGRRWRLARGSLTFTLESGTTPPDLGTIEQVGLLDLALRRAAEHDEAQSMRERWELLANTSFEGIMIHVDGAIIELNQRFCELSG